MTATFCPSCGMLMPLTSSFCKKCKRDKEDLLSPPKIEPPTPLSPFRCKTCGRGISKFNKSGLCPNCLHQRRSIAEDADGGGSVEG